MPVPYVGRGDQNWGNDLYVFQAGPYCKVGRSYDVNRRLKELRRACPYPVEVAAVFPGRGSDECVVHKHLATFRVCGEWFQICPGPVLSFIATMVCEAVQAKEG